MGEKKFEELSVVIPVYDDEKRLKYSLPKITDYLKKNFKRYELIMVLDPPTGNTSKIAKKICPKISIIENSRRMGKGFSVKQGMFAAKYDSVLFTDIDLSVPIENVEIFLPHLKKHQLIISSRNMQKSEIKMTQPFFRSCLGKIYPLFVRLFVIKEIKDTQCGFKLFRKEIIRQVFSKQRIDGFAFDTEILLIAKINRYRIKEVPVKWFDSGGSRLNIVIDPIKMLIELTTIKLNKIRGLYDGD